MGILDNPRDPATQVELANKVAKGDSYINVRDYGAVGDGVTNDRPAFINAFAAARAAQKTVYIPAGTYFIDGELDISGLTITGDLAGYFNGSGSIIKGNNTGITFNQQQTTLASITMNISGLRFINVATAIRFTYSTYSHIEDVTVIDASSDALVIGVNTIIGPIWTVMERVKVNSTNGYGLVLAGKDWCNSNLSDTCYYKGSANAGAVRINASGGFGAVDNIFRNTEIAGDGAGFVFDGITQATTIESCYIEPKASSVVTRNTCSDLQLQGNVYGTSGNDVPGYNPRFIDHQAGAARIRVIGGWVTTNAGGRQDNMDFVGSSLPASLNLEYIAEPSQAVSSSGFRLHDPAVIKAATRVQRGDFTLQSHSLPRLRMQYPDGSRIFDIVRNGVQGGTDLGVYFINNGTTSFFISNLGRLTFTEDRATSKIVAATTLGNVVGKETVRDESGNIKGYAPIFDAIT